MDPTQAYLDTSLWIPNTQVNLEGVKRALTFAYFKGPKREQQDLPLYKETATHVGVPREFWRPEQFGCTPIDGRPRRYPRSPVRSRIKLDHRLVGGRLVPTGETVQQEALNALLSARGGILQLACGKGKTVITLQAITILQVPALIVVDNTQLLEQWIKSIKLFLDVPGGVGLIEADVFDWQKWIVMATYQTLSRRAGMVRDAARAWFGLGVYDEAHHVNAPTFSLGADVISGRRYGLSATPRREDGLHIIAEYNFGPVFYKNLKQDLKPRIYFMWTGLSLDLNDAFTRAHVLDVRGELSLPMLAGFFGMHRGRLDFVLKQVRDAVDENRKVLVLSTSVTELVNLYALWNGETNLYSDIPEPTLQDVGEKLEPKRMSQEDLEKELAHNKSLTEDLNKNPSNATELKVFLERSTTRLKRHEVAVKMERLLEKRQVEYVQRVISKPSTAGLMIRKVPVRERLKMLEGKQVTFAIMKYGREGLDDENLDTVLLSSQVSNQGGIQQIMGRVLRRKAGKKTPVFIVVEDNVKVVINICRKMRKHLRKWPVDDGGPYQFEWVGYPASARRVR